MVTRIEPLRRPEHNREKGSYMTAKVGQTVQYFDSRGYGPFAATVLAINEATEGTEADEQSGTPGTPAKPESVNLEYTKVSKYGSVTRTFRKGIPAKASAGHEAASAAIPEGAEVCGVAKQARFYQHI